MMQTPDSPGKSIKMDMKTNPGCVNKQSASSCEHQTTSSLNGRLVSTISVGTQTDSRHKDESSQDSKQPNHQTLKLPKKNLGSIPGQTGKLSRGLRHGESLQQQTHNERALKNMKPESEISQDNEMLDLLSKETPQTPSACQEGTEETLTNLDKISPSSESEEFLHAVNSQQLEKNSDTEVQRASKVDPKESVSSKKALKKSNTSPMSSAVSTNKTKTDRGQETQDDQRRKGWKSRPDPRTPTAGNTEVDTILNVRLTGNAAAIRMEALYPETYTMDCENMFSFYVKSPGMKMDQQRMTPLVKYHTSGQMFTAILPDGTGQVCYPSGRLAILVAVAQFDDWFCVVVLEDKKETPRIQGVFTNRGRGTCYHENSSIWVNLTSCGGIYYSKTGDVKKHWSWQDNKHHIHAPPWKSLSLKLNPNLNIHIKSQENIYISFTSDKCSVQLNVGIKPKVDQGKGLMMPEPDMLLMYLKQKSAEINVLLQNIRSLTTYQKTVSPRKVKPQQSLISQMERRQLPVKQQQSAKKTP